MTILSALYTLTIKPLELIFEVVFSAAYQSFQKLAALLLDVDFPVSGLSIIVLSLAVNFLVLPLYRRADAMQEEERNTEARLDKWVKHIKATFTGDERTMMLQTYYRQNNYSPTHVLKGAVSLFLEIPFFIAAYNFLSHLTLLYGSGFGPIQSLTEPDGLIRFGGITLNLLPILMTSINVVSTVIFTKGYPRKTRLQLYAMAAFFLVFLYDSPSGLVLYWTLNNLFSLCKTLCYRYKNSDLVVSFLFLLLGVATCGISFYLIGTHRKKRGIFFLFIGAILIGQFFRRLAFKRGKRKPFVFKRKPSPKLFFLAVVFLALLTGVLIPSAVIRSSPQEFMNLNNFVHPLWYLVNSFLLAAGVFVLWTGVFYALSDDSAKLFFELGAWVLCGVGLTDYLFFGKRMGLLTANLTYVDAFKVGNMDLLVNLVLVGCAALLFAFLYQKCPQSVTRALAATVAAVVCMSAVNARGITQSVAEVDLNSRSETAPNFTLSRTGKNVVVIMIDRGMGLYVPYLFNEDPQLEKQFAGFTYYSNTLSFGGFTNFAVPALFGGYEYTPVEMNKRKDELLVDKHNEALKVMPVLFANEGYDVSVLDPSYANYQWIPDLSVFDDCEGVHVYHANGYFAGDDNGESDILVRNRNFFCYSIMKIAPRFLQTALYNEGNYNSCSQQSSYQRLFTTSLAEGEYSDFTNAYYVMKNLPTMTSIADCEQGSFVMMTNDITHSDCLLQTPDYVPSMRVNNVEYDEAHQDRFTLNGNTLKMRDYVDYAGYHVNMCAMQLLGDWFDYLREQGVYDNTRIIIVSDHGRSSLQLDNFALDDIVYTLDSPGDRVDDAECYFPVLLVKDYNATEFTTSHEFMTNADVPTLATEGIIENPVNPMTGKPINSDEKTAHDQYVTASKDWDVNINNGNVLMPGKWYSVHDDIWDKNNWTVVAKNAVFTGE